jgi:type II secretory pathway component PulM
MPMRWPEPLTRAIDGARMSERRAWLALAGIAALAVVVFVVAIPLQDAIARKREDLARDRLVLDVARSRTAENATLARASPPADNGDIRATIDRILGAQGLRYVPLEGQAVEGVQRITIEAAPFAALVRAVDALARDGGVRVTDASLTARVDPGTVRAEIVLTR